MMRKDVDNRFFSELSDLCIRYGLDPGHDFDSVGQLILYMGIREKDDEEYETMLAEDYEGKA
jgi:hypothetical protein